MPGSSRNVWRLVTMFHQKLRVLSRNKGDNDRNTSVLDLEMTTRITMKLGKICSGPFWGWKKKSNHFFTIKCNFYENRTLVRQTGACCYATRMQIPRPHVHRDFAWTPPIQINQIPTWKRRCRCGGRALLVTTLSLCLRCLKSKCLFLFGCLTTKL
jgi:hypothetical protein